MKIHPVGLALYKVELPTWMKIHPVGLALYKVELPTWMKIHPVLHVSNLKPYHEDPKYPTCNQCTRNDISIRRHNSREPEERTIHVKRKKRKEYMIKWKGLTEDEIKRTFFQPRPEAQLQAHLGPVNDSSSLFKTTLFNLTSVADTELSPGGDSVREVTISPTPSLLITLLLSNGEDRNKHCRFIAGSGSDSEDSDPPTDRGFGKTESESDVKEEEENLSPARRPRRRVEFQWFLMALSVRPGRSLAMVAHLFPWAAWAWMMMESSSGVKGRCCTLGHS
ncbi:hypothetical protein F8388_016589 [Cannabis sativa]|uniref:Chromo domain-containing protein n=1 Tax=Cannabis sativa TaxID=3483 RepID=A0A7J6HKL5_CANSA|nr:hypothetical protein F8388_016589 [Cannabis sativa]KAF4395776.1 hypothetical protein G4B88_013550 [Cannabis sativa]